jgi:hypothetical protein
VSRRDDPMGKRALFGPPPMHGEQQLPGSHDPGREAYFSSGPHETGTVVVDCSRCGEKTRISVLDAGIRLASLSLWIPGKRHSRRIRCPSCDHRAWCRVSLTE